MDPDDPNVHYSELFDAVEGWRAWRLVRGADGEIALGSLFSVEERWPARRAPRAVCAMEATYHAAPTIDCRCGYYAYADGARLAGASRRSAVVGSVALWGSVVGHDFGYRAEFAYPQRLRVVCGRCLRIGRDRSARWVIERHGGLSAVCARHAPRLRRLSRRSADEVGRALLDTYAVEALPPTGLTAPALPKRFVRGARVLLGAKTSIGWLLVAGLVASLAFWGASRTQHDGASTASVASRVPAGAEAGATRVGRSFRPPSVAIVKRDVCGGGPASNVRVVPCHHRHAWVSAAIFHSGILPKCEAGFVDTRRGGRTRCWVPTEPRAG